LKTEGDILDRAILTPCFVNSRTSEQPISSSGYPARLCSNGSFVPQPLRSRPCRERALLELWQELITRLHRLPRTRGKLDLSKRTSLNYSALRSEAQSGANTLQKETGVSIIILCLRYSKLFLASLGRTRAIRRSAHVVVKRRGGGHNQKASGHADVQNHSSCTSYSKYRPAGSIFVLFSNSCHSAADTPSGRVTSGVSVWNTLPPHFSMRAFLIEGSG